MRNGRPAELVLGSVQLGLAYGAANRTGKPARETALRLIARAADSGIAAFDTARAYGDAEERLGEGLEGRRVRTITKLAPLRDLDAAASRDAVRVAVDRSIDESRAALRQERLDCLLLHRAHHRVSHGGAVWDRLKEHLASGTIRALGVSIQTPAEAYAALEDSFVTHIQLPFNLFDWRWRKAQVIATLETRPEVTVHVRSVFLQGVLAANDASVWPSIPGIDPPVLMAWLKGTARRFGRDSVADLALAYARGQAWIDGVVVGQETEAQLDDNLRLSLRPVLPAHDCAEIEASAPRVPEALLDPAQWPPQ